MNIMLSILACSLTLLFFSAQSTSAQIIYPGIVVNFNCKVTGPFIQVNGHEVTIDRGIVGYVEDLLEMGIEAKNVTVTPQLTFIPTVCVNGSSPQLGNRSTTTITMTCQNFQLENGQFITIRHFNFTLKYQSQLPPPANVSMSDNNILEWSRPPSVTNSSSDTYSIQVNHTLEFTYTIFINITTDGITTTITVSKDSTTSYDLSGMLKPCCEYSIEVCARYSNTDCDDNERSPPITFMYMMPGCPVNPNPPASEDTVTTTSSPEEEDNRKQTSFNGIIILGVVIGVTILIIIVVLIITLFVFITKRNRKANEVTNDINPEDFSSKENTYEDSNPSHKPTPPTYEKSQHSIADEEQAGNGVYSEVHTTPPSTAGRNTQTTGSSRTTTNTGINGHGIERHGQQSPQRDLTYADLDLTKSKARCSPPEAHTDLISLCNGKEPTTD